MKEDIKAYLITSPALYPVHPKDFYDFYSRILDTHKIDFSCYRDKNLELNHRLLEVFLKLNHSYKIPSLINSHFDLGLVFGFDGIHCNGKQMGLIPNVKQHFKIAFFSAHNKDEIKQADKLGADGITISPIFLVNGKSGTLGVEFLDSICVEDYKAKIFALGGIRHSNLYQITKTKVKNFASIGFFLES